MYLRPRGLETWSWPKHAWVSSWPNVAGGPKELRWHMMWGTCLPPAHLVALLPLNTNDAVQCSSALSNHMVVFIWTHR